MLYLSPGASLSLKSFFARPFKKYLEAYRHKFGWARDSFSDCLAYLNAYNVSALSYSRVLTLGLSVMCKNVMIVLVKLCVTVNLYDTL